MCICEYRTSKLWDLYVRLLPEQHVPYLCNINQLIPAGVQRQLAMGFATPRKKAENLKAHGHVEKKIASDPLCRIQMRQRKIRCLAIRTPARCNALLFFKDFVSESKITDI